MLSPLCILSPCSDASLGAKIARIQSDVAELRFTCKLSASRVFCWVFCLFVCFCGVFAVFVVDVVVVRVCFSFFLFLFVLSICLVLFVNCFV